MKVFVLDRDPRQCARWLIDEHVEKVLINAVKIMSTVHRIKNKTTKDYHHFLDDDPHIRFILPKATNILSFDVGWIRYSAINYFWLADHAVALSDEYTYRHGKVHKYKKNGLLHWLAINSPFTERCEHKEFGVVTRVFPDEYKGIMAKATHTTTREMVNFAITMHRHYYSNQKFCVYSWKLREEPPWIKQYKDAEIPIH